MKLSTNNMFDTVLKSFWTILISLAVTAPVVAADLDRGGRADFALFRPSSAEWRIDGKSSERWGRSTDVLVPADYDGDGTTDLAVWRPENGVWYIRQSGDGGALLVKWGMTTMHSTGGIADIPVPADYDGDGRADIAVWRPGTGDWWILNSSTDSDQSRPTVFRWGMPGDVPVQGDYNGDGRADFAIFRSTLGQWWIRESVGTRSYVTRFGTAGSDVLVPADYNGDDRTDIAVYRSGIWYVFDIQSRETEIFHFGFSDDVPVPADYDGDGAADFATYRNGTWYVYDSGEPRLRSYNFGQPGDVPVIAGVVRQSIAALP